jgi:hypothetical protein
VSLFRPATKEALRARIALCGPTGSGKTYTALSMAAVMGAKCAVIDTERNSASLYSDRFTFDTLDFQPPYDPLELIDALKAADAEGFDVVVIDSLSHFWEGEGGLLDVVDKAAKRNPSGNSFTAWKEGTPVQRRLVEAMLAAPFHLIVTMRSKMEYVLETNERGKQVPRKIGLAPIQRQGIEYEFTLVGDIDLSHNIAVTKSRFSELADAVIPAGQEQAAAERFLAWLNSGEQFVPRTTAERWVGAMNALPAADRKRVKDEFAHLFGKPHNIPESRAVEVDAWLELIGDRPNGEGGTQVDGPVTVPVAAGATDEPSDPSPVIEQGTGLVLPSESKPAPAATPTKKIAKGDVQALRSFLLSKSFQPDELTEYCSVVVDRDLATMADLYAHEVEIIKLSTSMRAGR